MSVNINYEEWSFFLLESQPLSLNGLNCETQPNLTQVLKDFGAKSGIMEVKINFVFENV